MNTVSDWGFLLIVTCLLASCAALGSQTRMPTPAPLPSETTLDRHWLAFCARSGEQDTWDIFVVRAGGDEPLRVRQTLWSGQDNGCSEVGGQYHDRGLTWSPDGSQLAFVSGVTGLTHTFVAPINQEGTPQSAQFLWEIMHGFQFPTDLRWSPVEDTFAFHAEPQSENETPIIGFPNIFTVDFSGEHVRKLTDVQMLPSWVDEPAWSPDGESVAFALTPPKNGVGIARAHGTKVRYYEVPPSDTIELDTETTAFLDRRTPSWFADSTALVFVAAHQDKRPTALYRMQRDGSELKRLIDTGVHSPDVSPTAGQIVFARYRNAQRSAGAIVTIDAAGANEEERLHLTAPSNAPLLIRDLAWSPDGDYVAFAANPYGSMDVFVLSVSDGTLYRVTEWDGDEIAPKWRP